ncbi:hypothetical protein AX14_004722 [Amanita brunnescens Koide BX004]|nr:hypothetical protein AX14_004722 [Amanita brunnescens Koide BX004]
MMPSTAACMPLRTSQDAPCFLGTADDLAHYVVEVEELCQACQQSANTDLIKWSVYYTEGPTWDMWSTMRDSLPDPKTWEEFKAAICNVYPQHKEAHVQAPLAALLPPLPMPFAPLPSMLSAVPISPLLPQLSAPATAPALPTFTLALAAIEVLPPTCLSPHCCTLPLPHQHHSMKAPNR